MAFDLWTAKTVDAKLAERDALVHAIEGALSKLPARAGITQDDLDRARRNIVGAIDLARVVDGNRFRAAGAKATADDLDQLTTL
jgi:hypothetical protein